MTAVVAALGGLLVLMSKFNFNVSASNATALSAMMLGLAAATAVLGKIESVDKKCINCRWDNDRCIGWSSCHTRHNG